MNNLISRREAICGLAAAVRALAGSRNGIYNPELLADTAVWIREAEDRRKRPLELVDEAFAGIQRAGYRQVDLAGDFLRPGVLDKTLLALARSRLEAPVISIEGEIHRRESVDAARALVEETARLMIGHARYIALRCSPIDRAKSTSDLDFQAYQLNLIGQDVRRQGMGLLYRPQIAEMRENAREWRHVLANTEPKNVAISLDVEEAIREGVNPWQLIEAAGPRLRSVYLRNVSHGTPAELLGDGDIAMTEIAAMLRQMQYDGFLIVSLPAPRRNSTVANLTRSRYYAHEVFGARPGQLPVDMGPHVRDRK
jgi:sugar phosphate isomerase/epimerase